MKQPSEDCSYLLALDRAPPSLPQGSLQACTASIWLLPLRPHLPAGLPSSGLSEWPREQGPVAPCPDSAKDVGGGSLDTLAQEIWSPVSLAWGREEPVLGQGQAGLMLLMGPGRAAVWFQVGRSILKRAAV